MELAHILFGLMAVPMVLLIGVHLLCRRLTFWHPRIMPDAIQRRWYRRSEGTMAYTCAAMVWYGWALLPLMVSFCATDPQWGIIAHAPWIIGQWAVLFAKAAHLKRLIAQVSDLS